MYLNARNSGLLISIPQYFLTLTLSPTTTLSTPTLILFVSLAVVKHLENRGLNYKSFWNCCMSFTIPNFNPLYIFSSKREKKLVISVAHLIAFFYVVYTKKKLCKTCMVKCFKHVSMHIHTSILFSG